MHVNVLVESRDLMRGLNQVALVVDPVTESFSEPQTGETVEQVADATVAARAIIAVALVGAGFWYLLWKLALLFIAGR